MPKQFPYINIPEQEWTLAESKLKEEPDGVKLSYTLDYNKSTQLYTQRLKFLPTLPYISTHSFIKINGEIYALGGQGKPDSYISHGCIGKVILAQNHAGEVKILKRYIDETREFVIIKDLNLVEQIQTRESKGRRKYYVIMPFLGVDLDTFLRQNAYQLSKDTRLDLAIKMCWAMHQLHAGLQSTTSTPYAHLDIKPDNAVLDAENNVHLIDFGATERNPTDNLGYRACGNYYSPYLSLVPCRKEQWDMMGLRRSLFMPKSLYYLNGFVTNDDGFCKKSLLTREILDECQLNDYVNTEGTFGNPPDITHDDLSALSLTAILVRAKLNLPVKDQILLTDEILCYAIASCYMTNQTAKIDNVLKNSTYAKLQTGLYLANQMGDFSSYQSDDNFINYLNKANTAAQTCALVHLQQMGLLHFANRIIENSNLAACINILARQQLKQFIEAILGDDTFIKLFVPLVNNVRNRERISEAFKLLLDLSFIDRRANRNLAETYQAVLTAFDYIYDALRLDPAYDIIYHKLKTDNFAHQLLNAITSEFRLCSPKFIMQRVINVLTSNVKCQALVLLQQQGISWNKDIFIQAIYGSNVCESILLLHQYHLQGLADRILGSDTMGDVIVELLQAPIANQLTEAMLNDNNLLSELTRIKGKPADLKAFMYLIENNLHPSLIYREPVEDFYQCVDFLINSGLTQYLPIIIMQPISVHAFHSVLNHANESSLGHHLHFILELLPERDRLGFLKTYVKPESLKLCRLNNYEWSAFKKLIGKQALYEFCFSHEDIHAHNQLTKIRKQVRNIQWQASFFEPNIGYQLGKHKFKAPAGLDFFNFVLQDEKEGRLAASVALNKIKEEIKPGSTLNWLKQTLFGASQVEAFYKDVNDLLNRSDGELKAACRQ